MRQYGAKHHGVVSRYFYACQQCQHTDVWREIHDGPQYFERLRVPVATPKPEQRRFELPKKSKTVPSTQSQDTEAVKNIFSLSNKDFKPEQPAVTDLHDVPRVCATCARYFPEDAVCQAPEELVNAIQGALGIALMPTGLPVNVAVITDCSGWLDAEKADRFRVLQHRQSTRML